MARNKHKAKANCARVANSAYIEGMRELRRSNAAGPHAFKYTRRNKTRANQKANALKDFS